MSIGYNVYDEHTPIKHRIPLSNGDCKIQPAIFGEREHKSTVGPVPSDLPKRTISEGSIPAISVAYRYAASIAS